MVAQPSTRWHQPRQGKRAAWQDAVQVEGITRAVRHIFKLAGRGIDRRGPLLIVPEIELEGWTASLGAQQFDAQQIMALYADHGTHEQFDAEFKAGPNLQRLPSSKFDTNYRVCQLAAQALEILRLTG